MKLNEFKEMQRRIDEGIYLAQRRLAIRAREDNQSLVVCREGEIVEIVPDAEGYDDERRAGDPLSKFRYKKLY
ncbi:MAG: hypothetical protein ACI3X9_04125 [Bacteroidaceae bacterium]